MSRSRPRSRYNTIRASPNGSDADRLDDVLLPHRQGNPLANHDLATRTPPGTRSRQAQQAIQERIKEWILEHGLNTGDPMPTEAELVEQLGISRNSVREALKALQAVGIVETRHGFGTYVGDCSLDPFADTLVFRGRRSLRGDRHDLYEIVDLREALETGLISPIIAVIDDDGLAALAACLDTLHTHAGQGEQGDNADRAFHEQLFAPLDNQLTSQLLRVFWDVYHDLGSELPTNEMNKTEILSVHQAIYEAVAARDSVRAVEAVHEHFRGIRERVRR